ncbi:MAG: glycine cleavage system aminomethyltransferase GcvT [Gammaproteobacteria bacterium]|nr:glycine cleavage system aminomethyltransferase GcvT [Gammaproteobacteria bacterium]
MSAPGQSLKETPLHTLHAELGARLVPFAGYSMPVQYAGGIKHEHLHTRQYAGLFDVSHMGQIRVRGALDALERLVPGDVAGLATGQQRYSLLTNEAGGIIDDLMITRFADHLHLVVNAAFKDSDFAHLSQGLGADVELTSLSQQALLALQGPAAGAVMARLCPAAAALAFMQGCTATLGGMAVLVHRCGYTGEDGFEIAVANHAAEDLARLLLAESEVEPCGLGARDSLRLEAGLCLSGADIDAGTTPVEAALGWAIARKYLREPRSAARFPGHARILDEVRHGAARVRVGLRMRGRIPVRAGAELLDGPGRVVGRVTSGGFGPSLDAPVAMGYVERALAPAGTALNVTIRDTRHEVEVVALPFVPHRYKKS